MKKVIASLLVLFLGASMVMAEVPKIKKPFQVCKVRTAFNCLLHGL